MKNNNGFTVVEILVAIAIFVIIAVAIVPAIVQTFTINRLGDNETNATLYAQEGIEAARSIKNQSWANLVDGNHGLATGSGIWVFSGTSNLRDLYTRQVAVSDVQRNGSGSIVSSGGTADPNTKQVTSTVTWNSSSTRNNSVALSTYFTNWKTPSQAACLSVDISGVSRNHKRVLGITLQNTCSTAITISKITPSWTQVGNNITDIQINGTLVWSDTGPGSPSGNQPSGTVLTLQAYNIVNNSPVIPIDFFQMTGNILPGENWTIVFGMSDNSQNTVTFTTP